MPRLKKMKDANDIKIESLVKLLEIRVRVNLSLQDELDKANKILEIHGWNEWRQLCGKMSGILANVKRNVNIKHYSLVHEDLCKCLDRYEQLKKEFA